MPSSARRRRESCAYKLLWERCQWFIGGIYGMLHTNESYLWYRHFCEPECVCGHRRRPLVVNPRWGIGRRQQEAVIRRGFLRDRWLALSIWLDASRSGSRHWGGGEPGIEKRDGNAQTNCVWGRTGARGRKEASESNQGSCQRGRGGRISGLVSVVAAQEPSLGSHWLASISGQNKSWGVR